MRFVFFFLLAVCFQEGDFEKTCYTGPLIKNRKFYKDKTELYLTEETASCTIQLLMPTMDYCNESRVELKEGPLEMPDEDDCAMEIKEKTTILACVCSVTPCLKGQKQLMSDLDVFRKVNREILVEGETNFDKHAITDAKEKAVDCMKALINEGARLSKKKVKKTRRKLSKEASIWFPVIFALLPIF